MLPSWQQYIHASSCLLRGLSSGLLPLSGADTFLLGLQAELVAEAGAASAADYSRAVEIEGVGSVTVGVTHAQGSKCSRCWNFSSAGEGLWAHEL